MTALGQEILGCVNRPQLKAVATRYAKALTTHSLDKWDDEARWRRLVTMFGHDHAQELVSIAVAKFLDDALGVDS